MLSVLRCHAFLVAITAAVLPAAVMAQSVRGTLKSSASEPAAGAVVNLIDVSGRVVSHALANARGEFIVRAAAEGAYSIQALRIGFRPYLSDAFALKTGEIITREFTISSLRVALDTVRTVATANCSQADDRRSPLLVWEQVQSAVLTANSTFGDQTLRTRLRIRETQLDRVGRRLLHEDAQVYESAAMAPWRSDPEQLRSKGYIRSAGDSVAYFAPSLELLGAESFLETHCLSFVPSSDSTLIVMAFTPVSARIGIADISGQMTLVRATSELKHVDFSYTNIGRERAQRAGGEIEFARTREGTTVITRWTVKMPVVRASRIKDKYVNDSITTEVRARAGELLLLTRGRDTLYVAERHNVAGSVVDSATGRPSAGTYVEIEGTTVAATSDSVGRLVLKGLVLGNYTAILHTPTLDAIGGLARAELVVREGDAPFTLRAPSSEELYRGLCREQAASSGAITGIARTATGSPVSHSVVVAEWTTLDSVQQFVRQRLRAPTDSSGQFLLCGVPTAFPIAISISDTALTSTPVEAFAEANGFGYALVIAESAKAASGALLAIVTDSASRPVADAEVSVAISERSRFTGPDGRIRIADIPPGAHDVTVRRLGYGVARATISFSARSTTERHFVLSHVVTLDSVKTVAKRRGPGTGFDAFEERQKLGFGRFIAPAEIRKNEERRLSDLLRGTPSLLIDAAPDCKAAGCQTMYALNTRFRSRRYRGSPCVMAVMLDGVLMSKQDPDPGYGFDLRSISLSAMEAVEVYRGAAEVPSEFTGLDVNCGLLVLWTRRYHDDPAP